MKVYIAKIPTGQRGRPRVRYVRQVRPQGWVLIGDDWFHESQLEKL